MFTRRFAFPAATLAAFGAIAVGAIGLASPANATTDTPGPVTYNPVMETAPAPVGRKPVMADGPAAVSCCSWDPGVVSTNRVAPVQAGIHPGPHHAGPNHM
jgi:hypothetical protein